MNKLTILTDRIKAFTLATKLNSQVPLDKNKPIIPVEPEK